MNSPPARKRYAVWLLPLMLASCSYLSPHGHSKPAPKILPPPKPECQTGDFVQRLSLADLALSDNSPDMAALAPDLEAVQDYTTRLSKPVSRHEKKHLKEKVQQLVVVLECKGKADGRLQKLAAPFEIDRQDSGPLLGLVNQMNARSCLLNNIWPATVTVRRRPPLLFTDASPKQARAMVHERLSGMLQKAGQPAPLMDARIQLQLVRIFIDSRQRDGAYLALDNAKQALAAAEKTPDNKAAIQALLSELETMENELHEAMPFTL